MISIITLTYNHEKFIAEAINSVLKQKTNQEIEYIIGDDCSKDKTTTIITNLISNQKNIKFYKNLKNLGLMKNLKKSLRMCSGDYVCFCEGDDYWCNDKKIQTQYEFLEKNKDCSCCFHPFLVNNTDLDESYEYTNKINKIDTAWVILGLISGGLSTQMHRKETIDKIPDKLFDMFSVDWMFNIFSSQFGNVGYIDTPLSVYRIHRNGLWSGLRLNQKEEMILKCIDDYDCFFDFKYSEYFKQVKDKIINEKQNRPKNSGSFYRRQQLYKIQKKSTLFEGNLKRINSKKTNQDIKNIIKKGKKMVIVNNNISTHSKLHIGCGDILFPNWINIDISGKAQVKHDARQPFKYATNSIELIFTEHFIEHLTKIEAEKFVKECYRMLKVNGILRISTFDLDELIDSCHSMNDNWREDTECEKLGLGGVKTRAEYLNMAFHAWGHQYLYNKEEMERLFRSVGFKKINFYDINKSEHPELCNRESRFNSRLCCEGVKI